MTLNIGVVAKLSDNRETFGIRPAYVEFFSQFGAVSLLAPMTVAEWADQSQIYNMVVLPGGADLNPMRYGVTPGMSVGKADPHLEWFDSNHLEVSIQRSLVVGICRGHQSLAVRSGLAEFFQADLPYHEHSEDWTSDAHLITTLDYAKPYNRKVNSLHHQGVVMYRESMERELAKYNLKVLAYAEHYRKNQAILEAFEGPNLLGVQWHPEVTMDWQVTDWISAKLREGWVRK